MWNIKIIPSNYNCLLPYAFDEGRKTSVIFTLIRWINVVSMVIKWASECVCECKDV